MRGVSGRVYAVTGAAGGIGLAVCARLRDEGATVYELDLRAQGSYGIEVDVTDPASLAAAVAAVVEAEGSVDGLVAAAGVVEDDVAAEDMSPEVFDFTLGVNLRGLFFSAQAFGREFLERGAGNIVLISSMSGNHVVNVPQKQCAYNASKAGVSALARSLASEWADRGVRVNAVAPGYVDTPLLAKKRHQFEEWLGHTPSGRFARPEEIAGTVAFLLSEDASYYCGSELLVDGGYSLR
ncbi:SDR family oxidoreductase [Leucobacter sp. wl10]|uniref:SDR family oxidoreductase n=1 Tax=Leucobacter sp. wl10 TaxID=2304677 RepID=UPI000E5A33D1|nr:SDR family oxidoreductase [Leucobacter sp. wl10]RGE20496.1 SDR family oxidoreductase [Leucobacter sp. wl10]